MFTSNHLLVVFTACAFSLNSTVTETESPRVGILQDDQTALLTSKELDFIHVIEVDKDGHYKSFEPLNDHGSDIAASGQIVYRGMGLTFSELNHILDEGIEPPIVYQWKQFQEKIQEQSKSWSITQEPKKHATSSDQSIFVSTTPHYESALGFALVNRNRTVCDKEANTDPCTADICVVFRILTDSKFIDLKAFLSNRNLTADDSVHANGDSERMHVGKVNKEFILGYTIASIDKKTGELGKWHYVNLRDNLHPELPSFSLSKLLTENVQKVL